MPKVYCAAKGAAANRTEHKKLNRYKGAIAYDLERVVLKGWPYDYVNANYMPGFADERAFIAMQGPFAEEVFSLNE